MINFSAISWWEQVTFDESPRPPPCGCEERGRSRARERLAFSAQDENKENEDKENIENFRVPQTPSIPYRTPKQKSAKTPRPVSAQPIKPMSPLMAKQLPMLDDTCRFLLIYNLCWGHRDRSWCIVNWS
jgi:hypothetical protein